MSKLGFLVGHFMTLYIEVDRRWAEPKARFNTKDWRRGGQNISRETYLFFFHSTTIYILHHELYLQYSIYVGIIANHQPRPMTGPCLHVDNENREIDENAKNVKMSISLILYFRVFVRTLLDQWSYFRQSLSRRVVSC